MSKSYKKQPPKDKNRTFKKTKGRKAHNYNSLRGTVFDDQSTFMNKIIKG